MTKPNFQTPDLTQTNIDKIAALFPNCITETKGADGKLKRAVNFELLQQMLSDDIADKDEAYEFTWVGKKAAIVEANKPIRKTLRPCKEESVDWDTTENLYIEGDNLEVLKLLQESYLGKVKMIYIDPPYNTGKDSFVYSDNFSIDTDDYNELIEYKDENGNIQFKQNEITNPRFHSAWCSMMYSRLLLARNLLTDDGVIFISIDDNEVENLKKIGNEIFGERNFIGCAGRITKKANNQGDYWAPNFDYLLTYTKNINKCPSFMGGQNESSYNLIEEEGPRKGERYQLVRLYMTSLDPMRGCTNQRYYIECPDGSFIIPPGEHFPTETKDGAFISPKSGKDKVWRWTYQSYLDKKDQIVIKKGRSSNVVGKNGAPTLWNAFTKTYLKDVIEKSSATPNSFIEDHINQKASHELNSLQIPFSFAKPSSLMKYLAGLCRVGNNDIVLDFFSGSASTADAIIQYQNEQQINAHFIMVQIPELCDEDTDAYKAGFKNICEIGKERIRRAGKKIKEENLGTTKDLDIGFRVLKVDDSNMKDVYYPASEYEQGKLDMFETNIKEDRNDLDLLFGCLLDWGLPLSLPYTSEKVGKFTVHTYNDGDLVACFNDDVTEDVVKEIARKKPLRAVFRDSSFSNSASKINVFEIFKMISPETSVKVI